MSGSPAPNRSAARPQRRRSMAIVVMVWLALALLAVIVAGVVVGARISSREIRLGLEREAHAYGRSLADVLRQHVWNMDQSRLAAYFAQHPPQPGILRVEVVDQFDQPIHTVNYGRTSNGLRISEPVVRDAEVIGHVLIWTSLARMQRTRDLLVEVAFWQALGQVSILLGLGFIIIQGFIRKPTARLMDQVRRVAAGDYDFRFPESKYSELATFQDEVARLAKRVSQRTNQLKQEVDAKEEARQSLARLSEQLEDRVRARTLELEDTNAQLNRLLSERDRIQRELVDVSVREQRRIGQLLHDSLGQQLAGLSFMAQALSRRAGERGQAAAEASGRIAALAREALDMTRRLARGLSPVDSGERGLEVSLERLAADSEVMFGIACIFETLGDGDGPSDYVATQLYYITQEGVNNAARHADASQVEITLECGPTGGSLTIEDDGRGMDGATVSSGEGMGMHTMRYRAELIGGTLTVDSALGRGTRLVITFGSPARGA